MILFHPHKHDRAYPDERSREVMLDTISFFEAKGKQRLKEDDHAAVWYADFLDFVKRERIFATMCTPAGYGADDARWDSWRICEFAEILGFYGLPYWYTWQVSVLGLGPIWMSGNDAVKHRAAELLEGGAIFAFGLSEKAHGADLYSSEMTLAPQTDGSYRADGRKYYIGNGNEAALVSVFGKIQGTDDYVFFAVDTSRPGYTCIQNVVHSQNYVSEFELADYPVTEADILHRGDEAWNAALNTVNIGKFNLGWASIGICTHAFYEAIHHAAHRTLYGMQVTDFPHAKALFTDAYARLVAMKLVALRAADYMRSASSEDRRYLLFNPVVKMKVTTQGEDVINHLWDVIAAKGFEKDMYFEMAARDIRALPKLEGTVHVNIALIVKFMANYFFNPAEMPDIPRRDDGANDEFLFDQGPTRGLSKIRFQDYGPVFDRFDLPNVGVFREQTETFKAMLFQARPDEDQTADIDFLLALGEIFTLVVYAQLFLENAEIYGIEEDIVDQVFDVFVRDLSGFAVQLHGKPSTTDAQTEFCLSMIRKPAVDATRAERVWKKHVFALRDAYEMSP
ncbi:MAG: acyl-CoA dehydrogenase [Acidimicrobiia bacterium]|nr:acyl-CoA dehydrogenase [Acidimicrobiia bacterium]NNF10374.1 acyl-CoA dehydrogenase [Acidimicrobiia bacterium]NNL68424.1 acyl-CoA dehydrogenase [Acidimicrobiia bacterium]